MGLDVDWSEATIHTEAHDEQEIILPHLYEQRDYQRNLNSALINPNGPVKRAVAVWHRRAGKDKTTWNATITNAALSVGYYLYLFPSQTQAKKAIWLGRGNDGVRFLDHIPEELLAYKNNSELRVELINGSIIQFGGSDNYDAYMGTNPRWLVFSEWSICNPVAWDYFRPILVENDGTAVFIFTPRGRNHGHSLYKRAIAGMHNDKSRWFCELLPYQQTGVLTEEQVRREVEEEGMSEARAAQEFECSFDAEIEGAIYGKELREAYATNRVRFVPPDPKLTVMTAWDLGRGDYNAIWFVQCVGREVRLINYYQDRLKGMDFYIAYVKQWAADRGLKLHHTHFGPHDLNVHEYSTNTKRVDTAAQLNFHFTVVPRVTEEDGIAAGRKIFPRTFFDENECDTGLAALAEFQFSATKDTEDVQDELKKSWNPTPDHNWASHGAKAFQYLAQGLDDHYDPEYKNSLQTLANAKPWSPFDD